MICGSSYRFKEVNIAYNNRAFCDPDEVVMPVHCIGLNRGYVGFDFLKIVNGRLFYGDRHMKRFFRTLELMRLTIPQTLEEVIEILEEIATCSEDSFFGLKLFAIPLDSEAADPIPATLSIVPVPIPIKSEEFYKRGCKLVSFEYARFLPEAKSSNYLPSIYWDAEVKRQGAIEPLFHWQGSVLETARSNIFITKNGTVLTPLNGVLKGITRSIVVDLCDEFHLPIEEREFSLEELYDADEVFVTSTTKGVAPIVTVDGQLIGNGEVGEVSKRLIRGYQQLLDHFAFNRL